jgi:hypothetical protein
VTGERRTYELDGSRFSTLEGFFDEVSTVLIPGAGWGHNLDAFDDVLYGGFGTPEDGFRLIWRNAESSRRALGHAETVRQLTLHLEGCHPTSRESLALKLAAAREQRGPTVFDWLVEIVRAHEDIELVLE